MWKQHTKEVFPQTKPRVLLSQLLWTGKTKYGFYHFRWWEVLLSIPRQQIRGLTMLQSRCNFTEHFVSFQEPAHCHRNTNCFSLHVKKAEQTSTKGASFWKIPRGHLTIGKAVSLISMCSAYKRPRDYPNFYLTSKCQALHVYLHPPHSFEVLLLVKPLLLTRSQPSTAQHRCYTRVTQQKCYSRTPAWSSPIII